MMNESEFNRRVDAALLHIEEAIDATGAPIDYENVGGILTLEFDNGTQIIVNRQTPARQIWVAARSGGFHFDFSEERDQWLRDSDGQELFAQLAELASAQAGEAVSFA